VNSGNANYRAPSIKRWPRVRSLGCRKGIESAAKARAVFGTSFAIFATKVVFH
jgi:hypothetical protein